MDVVKVLLYQKGMQPSLESVIGDNYEEANNITKSALILGNVICFRAWRAVVPTDREVGHGALTVASPTVLSVTLSRLPCPVGLISLPKLTA